MNMLRRLWMALLVVAGGALLLADLWAPAPYHVQFRDSSNARPSARFPLGADELGRDRLSRLLYGSRISLLLASAAAVLSISIAAAVGGVAGYLGGWPERFVVGIIDLFLSIPWLFLLLTVRALLPLNVPPIFSAVLTFALLGLLGWAGPARVILPAARSLRASDVTIEARACGLGPARVFFAHVAPHLRPLMLAQLRISIPVFILTEANLGLLGLGVAEPLPSWGGLLRELENYSAIRANPWVLAPLLLLVGVMISFEIGHSAQELPQ